MYSRKRIKTISRIINAIKRFWYLFVYQFSFLFKIDDKLIVFESDLDFSDNSWVLYEYLKKNYQDYHFAWLMHGQEKIQDTDRTSFIHFFQSYKDVKNISKAKYLFYTHWLGSNFRPRKKQIIVNLWHGIPVKGRKGGAPQKSPIFNYLVCLGEMNVATIAKFVGCDISRVRIWGYPRIDLLYKYKDVGIHNQFVPKGFNGKVIMWMPTFRKSTASHLSEEICDSNTGLPILYEDYQVADFNNFLESINVCVLIKPHRLQSGKSIFKKSFSNLIFVEDEMIRGYGIQLYELVAKTDALLTDYSSIFIDYLAMDRPIGFTLDDIHEYEKSRGEFLYNPVVDVLCGNHIYTYEDLKSFCIEIAKGEDRTKMFRKKVMDGMIKYQDGNNCKRICQSLGL